MTSRDPVGTASEARPHPPGTRVWTPVREQVTRVILLADGEKPQVKEHLADVERFLVDRGAKVEVHPNVRELARGVGFPRKVDPDLVVVLGGDGSVLTAARLFQDAPVATIGVNFGRVGFLASLEGGAWREGLARVLEGRALIEDRMRLAAQIVRANGDVGARTIAMNDVVISRGATPSMARFELVSGGRPVTTYRADGLIFATPSGSTAYSLAAGGPILDPALRAVVLTPISAHALSHRPLVIGHRAELEARVTDASGSVAVDVDGRSTGALEVGDSVRLMPCEVGYPLLTLESFDPWRRLRDRLGWAGNFDE